MSDKVAERKHRKALKRKEVKRKIRLIEENENNRAMNLRLGHGWRKR